MKNIFAFFAAIALFVSCAKRDHEVTITYRVYYPGNPVTRTYTMDSTDEPTYILGSDRGSNYLYVSDGRVFGNTQKLEDTSAPIEIVSFRVKEK